MSFYVKRQSVTAWREEDLAASYRSFGPYETREAAIAGLNCELRREALEWAAYNRGPASPAIFETIGELRMAAEMVAEHGIDKVTVGYVRFSVVES